jgi:hypothetical protein
MYNTVLLATFLNHRRKVSSVLKIIASNFDVVNDKVFLLQDVDEDNNFILSYNVMKKDIVFSDIVRNTISLHRKKETNTLYTLNALNELVIIQNGELDSTFTLDWIGYENSILLTKVIIDEKENEEEIYLRQIRTKLIKVFNLTKE